MTEKQTPQVPDSFWAWRVTPVGWVSLEETHASHELGLDHPGLLVPGQPLSVLLGKFLNLSRLATFLLLLVTAALLREG
jgi:hypothetical protein